MIHPLRPARRLQRLRSLCLMSRLRKCKPLRPHVLLVLQPFTFSFATLLDSCIWSLASAYSNFPSNAVQKACFQLSSSNIRSLTAWQGHCILTASNPSDTRQACIKQAVAYTEPRDLLMQNQLICYSVCRNFRSSVHIFVHAGKPKMADAQRNVPHPSKICQS